MDAILADIGAGPVVQQVDALLQRAVELGAGDVHLEPFEEAVRARFRLDGVLRHAADLNPAQREALGSRIKVLAAGL